MNTFELNEHTINANFTETDEKIIIYLYKRINNDWGRVICQINEECYIGISLNCICWEMLCKRFVYSNMLIAHYLDGFSLYNRDINAEDRMIFWKANKDITCYQSVGHFAYEPHLESIFELVKNIDSFKIPICK